jgi:ATP-dependent DNA ligase
MKSALGFRSTRIRIAEYFAKSAEEIVRAVRPQELEGVTAKRKDSRY